MENKTTALCIVDMQNDVLKKIIATSTPIIPRIEKLLNHFRYHSLPVFHLLRIHRKDGVDVELFRLKRFQDQPFLIEGSEGAQIIAELAPLPHEYLICKKRFSGFFQTELLMLLSRLSVKKLVVCGVQTPNCIRCTVTDAISYDYTVSVIDDATASQTSEIQKANLIDMANMGVTIISTNQWIQTYNNTLQK